MISLTTACAIAGRTAFATLLPRGANRRTVAAFSFAIQVAGSVALLAASGTSVPFLVVGCILFGLGIGNLTSLPPLIAQIEFPQADAGRVVALVTAVNQAVFAFAPAALGFMRDASGWAGAPISLAALIQLAAAGMVLIGARST